MFLTDWDLAPSGDHRGYYPGGFTERQQLED